MKILLKLALLCVISFMGVGQVMAVPAIECGVLTSFRPLLSCCAVDGGQLSLNEAFVLGQETANAGGTDSEIITTGIDYLRGVSAHNCIAAYVLFADEIVPE